MQSEKNNEKKEKTDYFHVHHMIPRHSKYWSDLEHLKEDPLYKISLTIEGHSCQHDILYKVWGDLGDKIAAKALAGQMSFTEASYEAIRLGGKRGGARGRGKKRPEQAKHIHHATAAAALIHHGYQRSHWTEELWDDISDRIATGKFFWGAKEVIEKHGVTQSVISTIASHIKSGKTYRETVLG